MDFSFTEEQLMLKDSIARYLVKDYSFDARKKILQSEKGYSLIHWQKFADLGWLSMAFLEEDEGLGGSATDIIALMEELGKGLVIEPLLASVVLAGGIVARAGNPEQKQHILTPLMAGDMQLALGFTEPGSRYELSNVNTTAGKGQAGYSISGVKTVVLNGDVADKLIVTARTSGAGSDCNGISLFLVDRGAEGLSVNGYDTVDGFRAAEIQLDSVHVPFSSLLGQEGEGLNSLRFGVDRATLAICAEAVGAMDVAFKKTVEYTKIRKQFGVSISTFQALQHRMVDMFVELEQAKSIVLMAAMKSDASGGVDSRAISAAKSRVGKAARKISQEAVQLHGGIGVTEASEISHFFKRLTTIQYMFGSTDWHTQRFANL